MDADDVIKLLEYQKENRDDELVQLMERMSRQLEDLREYLTYLADEKYKRELPF